MFVNSSESELEMWVVEDMAKQITLAKQTAIVYLVINADLTEHTETYSSTLSEILSCLILITGQNLD